MNTRYPLRNKIYAFVYDANSNLSWEKLRPLINECDSYDDLMASRSLLHNVIESYADSDLMPTKRECLFFLIGFGILTGGALLLGICSVSMILLNAFISGFSVIGLNALHFKTIPLLLSEIEDRLTQISKQTHGFMQNSTLKDDSVLMHRYQTQAAIEYQDPAPMLR